MTLPALVELPVQAGYLGVGIDLEKTHLPGDDEDLKRCLFLEADLTDEKRLEEACKKACEWLGGRLDVLINNAGECLSVQFAHVELSPPNMPHT